MELPKSSANSNFGKGEMKTLTTPAAATSLKDRNLMDVSADNEQFEPTDARPVNAHKTMAGGA